MPSPKSTPRFPYTRWTARAVAVALLALVACEDPIRPAQRSPASVRNLPNATIQDGAHAGGGYRGFYFLPPVVPAPLYAGASDGSLAPTVKVCEWMTSSGACGREVARFSTTTGTGSELVRYDAAAEHYIVNWRTDVCAWGSCTLDPAKTYRLRVLAGPIELGFADVKVVSNMQQARNAVGELVALVGRTLPIKFRLEKGDLAMAPTDGTPTTVGASGATLATADGAVALEIPAGAVSGSTGITVERVPSGEEPPAQNLVPGTTYEFGPDGTQFAQPVTLTLAYDPAKIPAGAQERNLTLYHILPGGALDPVPFTRVNATDKTVSGAITHFSEYVVGSQAPVARIWLSGLGFPSLMGEHWIAEDAGASRVYVYLLDAVTEGNALHGRTVTVTQSNPAVLQLGEVALFSHPGFTENNEAAGFDISVLSPGTTTVTVSSEGVSATFTIHVVARSHELGAAALDFSPSANPNGQWSAGYTTTLGSPLKLYQRTLEANGLQYWLDPVNNSLNTPGYYKNVSDGIVYGSTPGQVSLHPGCNSGEFSVLRWTAPSTGRYAVQAQFFIGDQNSNAYGETTAHILLKSPWLEKPSVLFHAPRTSVQPTFWQNLSLIQGQAVDFVVGVGNDGCLFDTTPLAVTITPSPFEPFELGQAAIEFSATQNPNGPWSSGWTTSVGGELHLYTVSDDQYDGSVYWIDPPSGPWPVYEPTFNKNISNEYLMSSLPGQVSLTPGPCNRPYSVLRWTAPAAGTFRVDVRFYRGLRPLDPGAETTAHILLNGNAASPLFNSPGTLSEPTFVQTLTLNAGTTIDIVVGPNTDGVNCIYHETPLAVTITPVP